jgi:hypothetical protein
MLLLKAGEDLAEVGLFARSGFFGRERRIERLVTHDCSE